MRPIEGLIAPPHNAQAEEALIGSILIDPEILTNIALPADGFYLIKHGYIWQAMLDLRASGMEIDLLTVQSELERRGYLSEIGGPAYLTRLITLTPSAYNAPTYAGFVNETAARRKLIRAASIIAKLAYEQETDLSAVFAGSEKALLEVVNNSTPDIAETAYDVSSRVIDRLIDPQAFAANSRPTGLAPIDDALGGGLESKTMSVIMARPGMGKTAVLCQIADLASERGDVVVFLSKEMSAEQIISRMVARRARVNMLRLKQGRVTPDDRTRAIDIAAKLSERKTLFIDDSASQSTLEAAAVCNRIAHKFGRVDWIIADHLRLFADKADNETHRLGHITWSLKQLAKQLSTRVISAAQLSRAVESQADKRPDLKDLRDSGEIEEDADNVIGLYRDKYYNPQSARGNEIEFLFAKARDGERGAKPLMAFLEQFGAFELLARE